MNNIRTRSFILAAVMMINLFAGRAGGQNQKEAVVPPIPIGDRFTIETPQGPVTVKNFYPTALIVGPQSLVMDVDAFSVTYDGINRIFFITVVGESRNQVIKHRKEAETAFLRLLQVMPSDACRLNIKLSIGGAGMLAFNPTSNLPLSFCTQRSEATIRRNNRGGRRTSNTGLIGTTWKIFMTTDGTELSTYTFLPGGRIEEDEKAKWKLTGNKLNITEEYGDIDLRISGNLMTGNGQLGMNPRPFRLRGVRVRDNRSGPTDQSSAATGDRKSNVPSGRPAVYVEQGACPFECCTYREWWAAAPTPVYSSPSSSGMKIRVLKKGEHVTAVTGFVRTQAREFVVTRNTGRYRVGDTIWVYSYRGEGFFTVWFNGKIYGEDLGFSPYGGSGGTRCQGDSANCWGTLKTEHSSEWWIKLRLRDGRIGWTNHGEDYSGIDACG